MVLCLGWGRLPATHHPPSPVFWSEWSHGPWRQMGLKWLKSGLTEFGNMEPHDHLTYCFQVSSVYPGI